MPSSPPTPLAVDLDVLKLGTTDDPVSRDDVERALYALTGWQKPQRLIDAALDVVDSYATEVRAGRVVPARSGHGSVACGRAHLDEHTCPVTVRVVREPAPVPLAEPVSKQPDTSRCRTCAHDQHAGLCTVLVVRPPSAGLHGPVPCGCGLDSTPSPPPTRVRTGVRNTPAMTPDELLLVDERHVDQLSDAQRAARHVLLTWTQTCSTCGGVKALDEFYRDRARLTGHASRCKNCANAATSARRKTPG